MKQFRFITGLIIGAALMWYWLKPRLDECAEMEAGIDGYIEWSESQDWQGEHDTHKRIIRLSGKRRRKSE